MTPIWPPRRSSDHLDPDAERPGRHSQGHRSDLVSVAELAARLGTTRGVDQPAPPADIEPAESFALKRLRALEKERDELLRELAASASEARRLDALLTAATLDLVDLRRRADEELAAQKDQFNDRQTEWELRITELEKEVQKLENDLEQVSDFGSQDELLAELAGLRDQVQLLRGQLDATKGEVDAAYAESDAVFTELRETSSALKRARARLVELGDWDDSDEEF